MVGISDIHSDSFGLILLVVSYDRSAAVDRVRVDFAYS
jgi:hypothetical protein